MRFRPSLFSVTAFMLALACDAGESSDLGDDATGGALTATGGTSSTTGGTSGTTGGASTGTGGGMVINTGKGCTPGTMMEAGSLSGQYGNRKLTVGGQEYFLQVNQWNSTATQVMSYGGDHFFRMTTQQAIVPTDGGPTGFPSMFIGANAGNVTANSNLPKQVSALTRVPTTWDWTDAGTLGNTSANSYNVAYDVWFSTSAAGEPSAFAPSGGFLMVWLYDPPDAQPVGSVNTRGVSVANVPGSWDVWTGNNGGVPVISYLAPSAVKSMSFDLNDFIKDAVTRGTIQNSWYLSNVFVGFEIWRGGVNLEATRFCAIVE